MTIIGAAQQCMRVFAGSDELEMKLTWKGDQSSVANQLSLRGLPSQMKDQSQEKTQDSFLRAKIIQIPQNVTPSFCILHGWQNQRHTR